MDQRQEGRPSPPPQSREEEHPGTSTQTMRHFGDKAEGTRKDATQHPSANDALTSRPMVQGPRKARLLGFQSPKRQGNGCQAESASQAEEPLCAKRSRCNQTVFTQAAFPSHPGPPRRPPTTLPPSLPQAGPLPDSSVTQEVLGRVAPKQTSFGRKKGRKGPGHLSGLNATNVSCRVGHQGRRLPPSQGPAASVLGGTQVKPPPSRVSQRPLQRLRSCQGAKVAALTPSRSLLTFCREAGIRRTSQRDPGAPKMPALLPLPLPGIPKEQLLPSSGGRLARPPPCPRGSPPPSLPNPQPHKADYK